MFQATGTTAGHQRPAIMHAYGGAKVGMERSLASIAPEGWVPLAAAMLGTPDKPPMWACVGFRLVAGTTIDFRVLPPTAAPSSALSQWLVDIEVDYGPDGQLSPTYLKPSFNIQEAADLYQAAHLHTLEALAEDGPYSQVISQLALRILTYEYPREAIQAIDFLSATGHLPDKFPHDQWIEAVRWHGDTKIAAEIQTEAQWADAKTIMAKLENVVVEAESQHGVVVWSSAQDCPHAIPTNSYPLRLIVVPGEEIQRHLPETLHVEATGLGGRDLSFPSPGISQSGQTKKGNRFMDRRLRRWKKRRRLRASLEARPLCRSLHWAGVRLLMNSWCCITLDWTVPSVGMHSSLKSCLLFGSRVPQPVGLRP